MEFEVTEIKMLGEGLRRSLSLRLRRANEPNSTSHDDFFKSHTVHAVVPLSHSEFGNVQVGQKFSLLKADEWIYRIKG